MASGLLRESSAVIYLNCGSGQRPFKGQGNHSWVNIDCQERWRKPTEEAGCEFLLSDMENLPYPNEMVDLIVAHHVIEHMGCGEAEPFVKEAYRVLKPGGSLLVFVPDMRALAQRWLTRQLDTQVFFTNVHGAYQGDQHDRHLWSFDDESLRGFLHSCAGWGNVLKFDWRGIDGADLARDWWVLSIEAVK